METTSRQVEAAIQSTGMHGHFQVLAADERFSDLQIGLYRNVDEQPSRYEIVVSLEERDLDTASQLGVFAAERGLRSRFEATGEVVLFELV